MSSIVSYTGNRTEDTTMECTHEGTQKVHAVDGALSASPGRPCILCTECGSEVAWNYADFAAGLIPRNISYRGHRPAAPVIR